MQDVAAGSFITIKDGQVYVGDFNTNIPGNEYEGEPHLYRYDINPDGTFDDGPVDLGQIPHAAQGAAVTDDGVLFSTSYGDSALSPRDLVFQEFDGDELEPAGDAVDVYELDHYAEGITIIDDEVWVTYESGAAQYDGDDGRQWIQRIDLDDLGDMTDDPSPWFDGPFGPVPRPIGPVPLLPGLSLG